ncbi:hypothetical protein ROLI_015060 [Roseobacter fucihabitans]|uniref:DUF3299 domain-containing protein n=1 Tax=Roseobacter fucihabitans TaxID=1537242 RepID=A0ABZ2BRF2_9RHOB|nr:DUF3299 domain-containing protein [Roseobacter litoralis]MBC6965451.1 hypothetical protein [Roseobacter litoralis]
MKLSRRHLVAVAAAFAGVPRLAYAMTPRVLSWDDLIPPGVPYSEIIGDGEIDEINDTWLPVFDENATKLNAALDGAYIKMPGYMLPIDLSAQGVTSFIMVPYVGACIHVPPPPANQLVFVDSKDPWPGTDLWDPVWVTGRMTHELQSTTIADIGYAMFADKIEAFEW